LFNEICLTKKILYFLEGINMATKKAGGSTKNGRDSNPQYRGIKVYGGQKVTSGSIIVRQVGSTFHAGSNVGTGSDFTLFALIDGEVKYERMGKDRKKISVLPLA
jgi:large subunit ribosomal protein L27